MKKNNKKRGYTIIETMIAISLFLVVVITGMTALLNANLLHQKSQNMRSIMDNLSFIMEDMSRNIRTGTNFHCIAPAESLSGFSGPKSGPSCWAVAFRAADGVSVWVYYVDNTGKIFRSTDGGSSYVQLNPDEVVITNTLSPFSVLGAEPPAGDLQQPLVDIRLVGNITLSGKNVVTPFSLQTTVSERLVDI